MKRKIFSILFALVLVLSFSLVAAVPVAAQAGANYYVNADTGDDSRTAEEAKDPDTPWLTIQHAVDTVPAESTINVAAGTYSEWQDVSGFGSVDGIGKSTGIMIDKSLTLLGANHGVNAVAERGPESIIDAQEAHMGVLINGVGTIATFDGFTVDNYDIAGILAGAFGYWGEDPVEVHILNNIVKPPTVEPPHNNNIQVGDGTTGTIIGNEVSGALLESPDWSGSGILVSGSSNVVVSNNYVHNSEGGIQIQGYGGPLAENNLIENNLVEGNEWGISVQGNSIGTIIRYNDVLNNNTIGIGSLAYDYFWGPDYQIAPSGTEVRYNNIVGNVNYGVKSSVWYYGTHDPTVLAEEVDATCNWWGHASGPFHPTLNSGGIGNAVSDNVGFDPWLTGLFSMFHIDHAKIDFKKSPDNGKVSVKGKLGSSLTCGRDVDTLEDVIVTVGPLSQTITMEQKGKEGEKWEYKRPKTGTGIIKKMKIDWNKGKFDIRMDKANLTGITNPVTISVQIGDDFGEETIPMRVKKHHWDYKAPK